MAELGLVAPDRFPLRAVGVDFGVVGDDLDLRCLRPTSLVLWNATDRIYTYTYGLFPEEGVQHPAQNRLQTRADDVELDIIGQAEIMELAEAGVDVELLLHDGEAVLEGHAQRPPHLLGDLPEGPLARLDLLVEQLAALFATP